MVRINDDGIDCVVVKTQYANNGRVALVLVDANDGAPVTVATVNFPEASLASDEAVIKDYSENDGVLDVLVKAKVVEPTDRVVSISRYVPPQPVVKVLV